MEKYIGQRLVARPEPDNTFWTDSTRTRGEPLYSELYVPSCHTLASTLESVASFVSGGARRSNLGGGGR